MKRLLATGALLAGSLITFNAIAQPAPTPADIVATRQAVFKLLAAANGPMGGMARGGEFNKDVAVLGYQRIAGLAGMIPELFVADTRGADVETRAKDTIWTNPDDFATHANELATAARAAIDTLNGGGEDMRAIVGSVGRTCGGCHDAYRLD